MRIQNLIVWALVAIVGSPAASIRADVIIDSFDDAQAPLTSGANAGMVSLPQAFPSVAGGRALSLTGGAATATITPGSSVLDFSGSNATLSLSYGFGAFFYPDGTVTPGPMDLSVNPSKDVLRLTFLDYHAADGQDMSIEAIFGSTTTTDTMNSNGAQVLDIPLSGFDENVLNFVTFNFHAPGATSFQLDSVTLVTNLPEPATLSLLVLSMGILLVRRPGVTLLRR